METFLYESIHSYEKKIKRFHHLLSINIGRMKFANAYRNFFTILKFRAEKLKKFTHFSILSIARAYIISVRNK